MTSDYSTVLSEMFGEFSMFQKTFMGDVNSGKVRSSVKALCKDRDRLFIRLGMVVYVKLVILG